MLKGKRVTLRPVERDDLKRLHELHANVDLQILGGGDWMPYSLAALEKHFDKDLDNEDVDWFVIEADGKVIGDTGLHHTRRKSLCTSFGIGIFDPAYLGKGYGREVLRLLLDYAFRIQGWRRVWLETGARNERAIRAYKAVGFVEEGRQREHQWSDGIYEDIVLMGILKREWDALPKE